jgi:hypothetical protein
MMGVNGQRWQEQASPPIERPGQLPGGRQHFRTKSVRKLCPSSGEKYSFLRLLTFSRSTYNKNRSFDETLASPQCSGATKIRFRFLVLVTA